MQKIVNLRIQNHYSNTQMCAKTIEPSYAISLATERYYRSYRKGGSLGASAVALATGRNNGLLEKLCKNQDTHTLLVAVS